MKGFSTRYALTQGIKEVVVGELVEFERTAYVYTKDCHTMQLVVGRTFFKEREKAEANAREQARAKIASLEKQLAHLRKLANEPKWAK